MNKEQIDEQRESIKKAELLVEGLNAIIISLTNAKPAISTEIALSNKLMHVAITEDESLDKAVKLMGLMAEIAVNHDDVSKKYLLLSPHRMKLEKF
ncbi:MAG: hypothetical protein L0G51_00130 [Lactococcus lactis]|nr:hypothetical protein [Lactococcus lactis]